MRISEINRSALTRTLVDKLLYDSLEYSGERADLIIVLGSSKASRYRVPEAAKLYFAGRAEYLLFFGREGSANAVRLYAGVSVNAPRRKGAWHTAG